MQQNIILRINSEVHTIFVLLHFQYCLVIVDLINFEDVEQLVAHFDELIFCSVIGGKLGDDGYRRE
jgi:hypothetical protein